MSEKLDELDFGTDHYVLEVSTPGLDHPLKLKRQFQKNTGRGLKIHLRDKRILEGKLAGVEDEKITLRQQEKEGKMIVEKEVTIAFEEIERAFVVVSFK